MTRVVFLGTPASAVQAFEAVAGRFQVVAVVTQPDRPKGRSGKPQPSPVKQAALRLGLTILQPANGQELSSLLSEVGSFELGVVVAFGMMLRPEVLAVPPRGFLNLHFSLLPRWRGATPVVGAILAGDRQTGVTVMVIDQGLDTGPILAQASAAILPTENAGSVTDRLAHLGASLMVESIPLYLDGGLKPQPQPHEGVTYAPRITAEDRKLNLSDSPSLIVNRVRALAPKPSAYLSFDGLFCKVLEARVIAMPLAQGECAASDGGLACGVGGGSVELVVVQPEGKKVMTATAWIRGLRRVPYRAQ